jgi:hypothetical protein
MATEILNMTTAFIFQTSSSGRHGTRTSSFGKSIFMLLLSTVFSIGCNSVDKMRGDGFSSTEDWGQELRGKQGSKSSHGGFATKAQQIEKNLGVE